MTLAGSLYRSAAMHAVRRGDAKEALLIAERGRALLVAIALRLDAQARKLPQAQQVQLSDLRQQFRNIQTQLSGSGGVSELGKGVAIDAIAYNERQNARRDRAVALRVQIRALLPPPDPTASEIPQPPSGGAILLPLVSGDDATLLLVAGDRVDAVPLPDLSEKALRDLYEGSADDPHSVNWRDGYTKLATTLPSGDLPTAWKSAHAYLAGKFWTILGAPMEQALMARGVRPGGRLIILPSGLLAQLPIFGWPAIPQRAWRWPNAIVSRSP